MFLRYNPTPEDFWRGILLFGKNCATYKFAVACALLELKPPSGRLVKLEDLARPFTRHLCEHLKSGQKQGTARRSRFLDACRRRNAGEITECALVQETLRFGFQNVIDAFHVIGSDDVPQRFFVDERSTAGGIRVTDAFSAIAEGTQASSLPGEAEARWRLVETAWELGLSRAAVVVRHDLADESLFVIDPARRRKSVTSARAALSGYQKGCCFYCFDVFNLRTSLCPEVDHFFPQALKSRGFGAIVDGIWNLVLACPRCNRGSDGKCDRIPGLRLLERLHTRNEFLIASQHPLRETLMQQIGRTEEARRSFLNAFHGRAFRARLLEWQPVEVAEPLF